MKTLPSFCLILFFGLTLSCNPPWNKEEYHLVNITGPMGSYSTESGLVTTIIQQSGGSIVLPIEDGECLVLDQDGNKMSLIYRATDGNNLSIRTLPDVAIFCNNQLVELNLKNTPSVLNFLSSCSDTDLASLRSIFIHSQLSDSFLPEIVRIAKVKPGVGLELDGNNPKIEFLLSLFNPSWINITDIDSTNITKIIRILSEQSQLEKLFISSSLLSSFHAVDAGPLLKLTNLQHLSINLSDSIKTDISPFMSKLSFLKSLSLQTNTTDISFLKSYKNLKRLILDGPNITSINDLVQCTRLTSLSLAINDSADLQPLEEFRSLKFLSLPGATRQEQFEKIVLKNQRLVVLSFVSLAKTSCNSITDLSPLRSLSNLKALFIWDTLRDYKPLYGMKNLKVLSIPSVMFEDSSIIKMSRLQKNLPQCKIEPGLCMGSGWIMFLFPGFFITSQLFALMRRKRQK